MSGKLEFGCDYLNIMRNLELRGAPDEVGDPVADAAARMFLLHWGFSVIEIDETNKLFWDRVRNNSLESDLLKVIDRVYDHIKDDKVAQERLVTELAAIGDMDLQVNDEERVFVNYFRDKLDMKPSEFNALCSRGTDWAVALNYFGDEYLNYHNSSQK
jgi:hypothetical protein